MKTVIIYRKSSQKYIDQYQILFQPFIDSHQIAFCFWDEHANDFASALTNLEAQLQGERTWRAIVALPVSDDPEDEWDKHCRADNPFDFLCNAAPEPDKLESSIPLVTVSQMLGGIPLVTPDFRSDIVITEGDRQHDHLSFYRADKQEWFEQRQAEWDRLNVQYSTHCALPSSLYLFVGMREQKTVVPEENDLEILQRHESDSSMFWYRNCYPAKARFLTQISSQPGNARYKEDIFAFWMTVLTLATNEFPSGTIEAYKLYNVKAGVSREILQKTLSSYYSRLDTVRYIANLQIQEFQKEIRRESESDDLPKYQMKIPVVYSHMNDAGLLIPSNKVGLSTDCPIEELSWWHDSVRQSQESLKRLLSSTKITLDRASVAARILSVIQEGEMVELNEYQVEELEAELHELESETLSFTSSSILPTRKFYQQTEKRKVETAERMKKRLTREHAVEAGLIGLSAYLIGFVPDIVRQFRTTNQPWTVVGISLLGTIILGLCGLGFLFFCRSAVRRRIGNYNETMTNCLDALRKSAEYFSAYISKCCSYMRGRSILQYLEHRTMIALSGIRQMKDHKDHSQGYISLIESWLEDFNLHLLKNEGYASGVTFDFDIPPVKNKGYMLEHQEIPNIRLEDGNMCTGPYPFVTEFQIRRIAVFEKEQ